VRLPLRRRAQRTATPQPAEGADAGAVSMLHFQPAPFFGDKSRAFWRLQLAGWGGAALLRAVSAIAGGQQWDALVLVLIATVTGFSISVILSVIYGWLINQRALLTWSATVMVLAAAVSLYSFINAWVLQVASSAPSSDFAQLFIRVFYIDLTLLGAWSALYYAINFFLQVEEQADRLERLEAQATSAQLAMLRYQLNPHFLFNTLNSISTLVLLKQTEPANAMLTRLSSFLRHTLVIQPGGKVTVAQEVDTLKLYLEIERMRFEERLRTVFRIDPAAADAMIPSLLLQPLVENAIKYAVSPQEEGARISLTAQVVAGRLRLMVADTGPGLQSGPARSESYGEQPSTGLGLANIRNRLTQAYGEDHRFEIETPPEGGFTVTIEVPLERAQLEDVQSGSAKPTAAPSVSNPPEDRAFGTIV
jgi:sensor histidine kinase YesM